MVYCLSDAVTYLLGIPWVAKSVDGELVEGYFDGINTHFRVASPPIADTTKLVISDPAGVVTYTASGINGDTGAFTVSPAPASPVQAAYTTSVFSGAQLTWLARKGLDEMESRWRRNYSYVADDGDFALSSDRTTPTDPAIAGDTTFSESRVQVEFYHACCELVLLRYAAQDAAVNSISYREERVGGLSVDASRRARDMQDAIATAEADARTKEAQARSEAGDVDDFGYFISGPRKVNGQWTDYGSDGCAVY